MSTHQNKQVRSQNSLQSSKSQSFRERNRPKDTLEFEGYDWTQDFAAQTAKKSKPKYEINSSMISAGVSLKKENKPDYLRSSADLLSTQTNDKNPKAENKRFQSNPKTSSLNEILSENKSQGLVLSPQNLGVRFQHVPQSKNFQEILGNYPETNGSPKKEKEKKDLNVQYNQHLLKLQYKIGEGIQVKSKSKNQLQAAQMTNPSINPKAYEMISDIFHTGFNQPFHIKPKEKINTDQVSPEKPQKKQQLSKNSPRLARVEQLQSQIFGPQENSLKGSFVQPDAQEVTKHEQEVRKHMKYQNYSNLFDREFAKPDQAPPKMQCLYGHDWTSPVFANKGNVISEGESAKQARIRFQQSTSLFPDKSENQQVSQLDTVQEKPKQSKQQDSIMEVPIQNLNKEATPDYIQQLCPPGVKVLNLYQNKASTKDDTNKVDGKVVIQFGNQLETLNKNQSLLFNEFKHKLLAKGIRFDEQSDFKITSTSPTAANQAGIRDWNDNLLRTEVKKYTSGRASPRSTQAQQALSFRKEIQRMEENLLVGKFKQDKLKSHSSSRKSFRS